MLKSSPCARVRTAENQDAHEISGQHALRSKMDLLVNAKNNK